MMLSSTMRTLIGGTELFNRSGGREDDGVGRAMLEEEEFLVRLLLGLDTRGDETRSTGGVEALE